MDSAPKSERDRIAVAYASSRRGPSTQLPNNQLPLLWSIFITTLAAAIVCAAVLQNLFPYLILSALSVFITYLIFRNANSSLHSKSNEIADISRLLLATAEALATAIDAKDQTTHCHVRRVQIYAAGLGRLFGLTQSEIAALKAGAVLHDVGKLAVPSHILSKPDRLTPAEFERMKIHTVVGAQILSRVDFPYPVVPIIRHHHEQWDGRGYPDQLKGEQIPLTARILAVVDCFDSVREDRPFRRGMTIEEATALLRRGSGNHFDPQVVEMFLRYLPDFEFEIHAQGLQHHQTTEQSIESTRLSELHHSVAPPANPDQAYNVIKQAHREVNALYEIARTFGTSLNVEQILEILVDKVAHIVPFDTCAVYLYDEAKGHASVRHVVGKNAELINSRCVAPGQGVTGFALANRTAVKQLHPNLDFTNLKATELNYSTMASLPLFKDEVLIGAISLYSSELTEYTEDQMRLLETVTRLASDALTNAMRHAQVESHALSDPLTGLPNARALKLRFDEEAARAQRTNRTFQVLMLDLDDFKKVNDSFGHKIGDRLLHEIGAVIHKQLREYDFLARYGGDEFVGLVQELVGIQVDELCIRIEKAVAEFALPVSRGRHARVGISIGSATFGIDGETLDELLMKADQEMYQAKSVHRVERAVSSPSRLPVAADDIPVTSPA